MGLKMSEVLLILVVVLLLFGTSRLPQLGQSLGSAIRNFKKGYQGDEKLDDEAKPAALAGNNQGKEAVAPTKVAEKNS